MEITENEMLAALADAVKRVPNGEDGLTSTEICAALGVNMMKARNAIRTLIQQGTMRPVQVRRMALDGRNALVSGYQFVKPAPVKRAARR